jgi:hypothetical protein
MIVMTLGCDRSNGLPTGPATSPQTGAIHITVSTEGSSADFPDGYGIMVDGRGPMAIGVQGALTVDYLAPTSHFVNLVVLASNCSVAQNDRWVDVVAGRIAELVYNVKCDPKSTDGDCGWYCYYWSQSVRPPRYDIVSAKARAKLARVP